MTKASEPIQKIRAQQIHSDLVFRATNFDGSAALDWCDENNVAALLSGSMPGHTSTAVANAALSPLTRHVDGLRPLRAMAFGRWEPTHLWLLTDDDAAAKVATEASSAWGALTPLAPDGVSFDRPSGLVALHAQVSAPDPSPAPLAATQGLRENPKLTDATPLELQLELLRRTRFNRFNGPKIHRDLVAHAELWCAAIFGRDDVVFVERNGTRTHASPFWNTLNLLPAEEEEGYNADQLWVLTPSAEAGRAILEIARRAWHCDERRLWNRANSRRVAGAQGDERVVSLWWD
jgi:hypothetical protein